MSEQIHNVVIVGSGPAGCTAAIYAARAGLSPVLVEGMEPGGQLTTTPEIGNWPGAFEMPSGFDLMQKLQQHARDLGTVFISDKVEKSSLKGKVKSLTLSSGQELKSRTVIICTGAAARYLGLPSEEQYKGKGVSACATCDGFFFRNKTVAVIGGGSAAFVEAVYLCGLCSKVYLVHRREGFRSEQVLVDKFKQFAQSGKAQFVLNATVDEIKGDGNKVTALRLKVPEGIKELEVDGVFVAIGHNPATEVFSELQCDEGGYLKTGFGPETATSLEGVFAAGDCADHVYRQAITSAGQGCKAALDVEHYLQG